MKARVFTLVLVLFIQYTALSQRYWVGAASNDWNTPANWSTSSGGPGGSSVPGASDNVFFDANSINPCILTGNVIISIFSMTGGTLTISGAAANTLTVNSTFTLNGGVFNAGTNTGNSLSVPSNTFTLQGGILNAQTATFFIGNNFFIINPNAVNPGTSKVIFNGAGQQDVFIVSTGAPGLAQFYDLEVNKANNSIIRFTATATDTFQVNHLITLTAGQLLGSGFVKVEGDLITKPLFGGSGIPIAMTGPNPTTATFESSLLATGVSNFVGIAKSSPTVTVDVVKGSASLNDTLYVGNSNSQFILRRGILRFPGNPPIVSLFSSVSIEPGGSFISTTNTYINKGQHINLGGIFDANGGTYVFAPTSPTRTSLTNNKEVFNNLIIDHTSQFGPGDTDTLIVNGTLTFKSGELHGDPNSAFNVKGNMDFQSASNPTFGVTNLVFSGTTDQNLTFGAGRQDAWNGSVIVNKPSGNLILQSPMILDEFGGRTFTFTRGNVITTATNYLSFKNGVTAVGANNNSYVDGPVQYSWFNDFDYPIGNGGFYAPIRTQNSGTDVITAQYFHQNPDSQYPIASKEGTLNNVSHTEYWTISKTGTNSPFLFLSFENNRSGGVNIPTALRVARWNGTQWTDLGNGGITGAFVRSLNGIQNFSPFTLGSSAASNPLPVHFISFTAELVASGGLLKWTTSDEINNDHFDIQRSADGINFTNIGVVPAQSVAGVNNYLYTDNSLLQGRNFYRLQQVDRDGKKSYSTIVDLVYSGYYTRLKVYPNPAISTVTVQVTEWAGKKIMIEVMDIQSKIIQQMQVQLSPSGIWTWNQLPSSGLYLIRLKNESDVLQSWLLVK